MQKALFERTGLQGRIAAQNEALARTKIVDAGGDVALIEDAVSAPQVDEAGISAQN